MNLWLVSPSHTSPRSHFPRTRSTRSLSYRQKLRTRRPARCKLTLLPAGVFLIVNTARLVPLRLWHRHVIVRVTCRLHQLADILYRGIASVVHKRVHLEGQERLLLVRAS